VDRLRRLGLAVIGAALMVPVLASSATAFDGFGETEASSTYGQGIRFVVSLDGGAPDRLELLIRTPGSDTSFVAEATMSGASGSYFWDTSTAHLTPNTLVTYRWRGTDAGDVTLSEEDTIRYEDDRPGLDWETASLGEATVHWYGDHRDQAVRFGEVTAIGVEQAEELLGTELAGPVDVFVYDSQEDFFGALGPGAREWTGAAAYSEIRTIFMWLGGGSPGYLEQAMIHEVTHIVFNDATTNAFHEPARWLNEGLATWSETRSDDGERQIVQSEASGAGLFSFQAISEQFPIGERGAVLSYAQGTSMVQLIVDRYGESAIAEIAAALRGGASDDDSLEAGTGVAADQLYADFFASFGAQVPEPITPEPIPPSSVGRPDPGEVDPGGVDSEPPGGTPAPTEPESNDSDLAALAAIAAGLAVAGIAAFGMARRGARLRP
jgi:hypothetical protein